MVRMRVPAFCAVMLLLAACSGGGGEEKKTAQSSLTAVSRPIVAIVPAASIGKDGRPVDPALAFAPEAPQITVVAQVAEVTGSPMDLTWSQVTDKGEKRLFTHTVEVASYQAAYSVGKSPGTLTPGTYRVEATLEGESLSTQFEVEAPEGTGAAGQGATSGPPGSGDSGAVATPASDVIQQPDEAAVVIIAYLAPVDPNAPIISVMLTGYARGGGRLEGKATMGGSTRTVSYPLPPDGTIVTKNLDFNPCAHPGGSDLPDTRATFEAAVYKGNESFASDSSPTTLGPDETSPVLDVTSNPPPGSKVEPGQDIVISIAASESRSSTWQTGVKQIKLTDFDTGSVVGDQIFGEQALPCAQKAWSKGLDIPYTVPQDAPPEIRLVAEAFDFAEKRGSFGLSYFTGEVWEGPVTGRTTQPGCSPSRVRVTGDLEIVVKDDGTVTGSVTQKRGAFSCFGTAAPATEQTYPISGRKTAAAFELTASGTPVTMPISGTRASKTFPTHGSGGYSATVTFTITCMNC